MVFSQSSRSPSLTRWVIWRPLRLWKTSSMGGGRDRIVGMNPLAIGIPAGRERPFVMDAAFAACARGKVVVYHQKGQPLPEGSRAADERQNQFIAERAGDQRTLEHIARLREVADDVGCTVGQLALAWVFVIARGDSRR